MNKTTVGVCAVIVAILIASGLFGERSSVLPLAGESIRIGSIAALTGAGASVGAEEANGAELAVEEVNAAGGVAGRPLVLVKEDVSIDKLKAGPVVAQKLISADGVVAIVGPQWDEPAQVILPVIEEAQVPMVGADNTDNLETARSFDYFFSTWYDNRIGIEELLKYVQAKGFKRVVIIRPLGAGFWQFTADHFETQAPKYGVEVVMNIDLGNPLLTDFRTPLAKVKAAEPEALFMVVGDLNQCIVLRQMREGGLDIPLLSTEAAGNSASLRNCPQEMENIYFSTPKETESYKKFAARYKQRFGHRPEYPSAATAYDAVRMIAAALEKTNGRGGKELRDALAATRITGTGLAEIAFNAKGFAETPADTFIMMTVRRGKYVFIE